jgi:protein involved in temperature-dependent protein secretion
MDGRAPLYLRALTKMEAALYSGPPFAGAVRAALAFAYVRAGHLHAAAEQLAAELADLPPGDEADRVAERLRSVELEIARERYWTEVGQTGVEIRGAGRSPELLLRLAHSYAVAGDEQSLTDTLAQARAAGYGPRPAMVTRFEGEDSIVQQLSDVHLFIAGGLECVLNGELRFLPFNDLSSIVLGPAAHWRAAQVELITREMLEVDVPALYRLSLRSPNDLIQSGRFTQFKYSPGETRYARALGSRNLTTENSVVAFTDVKAIRFL